MIAVSKLRERLAYDPCSGVLTWRHVDPEHHYRGTTLARRHNSRFAGTEVGTLSSSDGYLYCRFDKRDVAIHRLIWAVYHGEWPTCEIDHINGVRTDNRIQNLRQVSSSENSKNMKRRADNKSGVMGVFWYARKSKWIAYINSEGKRTHIGSFGTKSDAVAARKRAERDLGFHRNHGRPA